MAGFEIVLFHSICNMLLMAIVCEILPLVGIALRINFFISESIFEKLDVPLAFE